MIMKNRFKILSIALSFFIFNSLYGQSEVTITVWVHGTYPALKLLSHNKSPFRSWVYAPRGLSLAKDLPQNYHFNELAQGCYARNSQNYNIDHFYLYGWFSSNLRPNQRKHVGQQLCEDLNKLIDRYKEQYDRITVRLIGFSHGGNVVLNCLNYLPFDGKNVKTEVILLATPVQESTRGFVNNAHVDKAYSFYSDADLVQRMDIQKLHRDAPKHSPFWSKKTFPASDNVVQVRLKINGKSIGHGQYRSIAHYLPDMMKKIQAQQCDINNQKHIQLDFKTK